MSSFFDNRIFREASHLNGFSGNPIERWSEARGDIDLAGVLAADNAVIYLFAEDRALLRANSDALNPRFGRAEANAIGLDSGSLILLGIAPDGPRERAGCHALQRESGDEAVGASGRGDFDSARVQAADVLPQDE